MFKIIKSDIAQQKFFFYFRYIYIIIIALFFILLLFDGDNNNLFTVFSIILCTFIIFISTDKLFINNPLSIMFIYYTFLFVTLPSLYLSYSGSQYEYGRAIELNTFSIIFDETNIFALAYLLLLYIFTWRGLRVKYNVKSINFNFDIINLKSRSFIILTLLVLTNSLIRKIDFRNYITYNSGTVPVETIASYLLYDTAFIIFTSVIVFVAINNNNIIIIINSLKEKIIIKLYIFFFIYIVILLTYFGSKASVLLAILNIFIIPLALSIEYRQYKIIIIKMSWFILILFISILFFFIVNEIRKNQTIDLSNFTFFNYSIFFDNINKIMERLTWGSFEQYLIIFNINNSITNENIFNFIIYIFKSTVNLVLPGTYFYDAIAPSSEIFKLLITNDNIFNIVEDKSALIEIYNSQPYSLYGLFLLIFGFFLTPFLIFLYMKFFSFIYFKFNNILFKAVILSFFVSNLTCFGIDADINNSFHLFISIFFMFYFCKIVSKSI